MASSDGAGRVDVLLVGAGLAAVSTASALRRGGFTGTIRVLGDEGVPPYDRPPLSKHLFDRPDPVWLTDELGMDLADLVDDVRPAEAAVALDLSGPAPIVRTDRDEHVGRDVVLATGAGPLVPSGWTGVRTLRTHADAVALRAGLRPHARLVVVGAGWIGAEVAGVAARAGHRVSVVEAGAAPLAGPLGPVGARTSAWYAQAGVDLRLGATVREAGADGVVLTDGSSLAADVVLVAIGARPATAWMAGAVPLGPDGAIRVDAHGQVLRPDAPTDQPVAHLWAVGDVATRSSPRHGWVPGGHWDGALRGPQALAAALLGTPGPVLDPAPYVFSTQLGHELALFGLPGPDDEVVLRERADGWTALWLRDDVLEAAFVVDGPREVAAVRRMMSGPALPRVDRAQLADPGRPLSARSAGSR